LFIPKNSAVKQFCRSEIVCNAVLERDNNTKLEVENKKAKEQKKKMNLELNVSIAYLFSNRVMMRVSS
jgi:hypothetical protein